MQRLFWFRISSCLKMRLADVRREAGAFAAHRRQKVRGGRPKCSGGRPKCRSAQNCGTISKFRGEKSVPAYPTFYLPQRTSRFTMHLGSAQASRRVTDLATAPTPHFPGVGATLFLGFERAEGLSEPTVRANEGVTTLAAASSLWPSNGPLPICFTSDAPRFPRLRRRSINHRNLSKTFCNRINHEAMHAS
jgi:hypothetical protein